MARVVEVLRRDVVVTSPVVVVSLLVVVVRCWSSGVPRPGSGQGEEQGVGKGKTARKGRPTRKQRRSERSGQHDSIAKAPPPNPTWFVPVMLGLMIIGLIWVVVYYLSAGQWPVSAWHNWNLLIGFAFIVAGFIMTTRWR